MRNTISKSKLDKYRTGGKDPNYIVRSWASKLGTVTQGHKLPKYTYRSQWLQTLNRVELMQNVEVQQTLRNVMSILKAGDEIMQDSDSAYKFAEKRRIKKCHEAVCKIRRNTNMSKTSSKVEVEGKDKNDPQAKTLSRNSTKTLRKSKRFKVQSPPGKELHVAMVNRKFAKIAICKKDYESFPSESTLTSEKLFMNQEKSPDDKKVLLPPIPESPENALQKKRKDFCSYSQPTLDTESKFCIIKRAKELRNERDSKIRNQTLTTMSSEMHRKYSKARKTSLKNYRDQKIEIFGDNRKLLNEEAKVVVEDKPTTLPLLDRLRENMLRTSDLKNICPCRAQRRNKPSVTDS
ncbi:hypothetical protein AWC38_SpisGene22187 [Stylophora pistillata]|uniref:Uncharacterized protein n=1 Tax=Stylophora pistillata TaxID=50429 RepID=A0A2B4R5T0_STYPI|nr:hypothetical protein AWC38_SpisGene22187 [Stylophora pistillata]